MGVEQLAALKAREREANGPDWWSGAGIDWSSRQLLGLTFNDPDRRRIERILLDCLAPGVDRQLRALAVTRMGHVVRLHGAVSLDVIQRLRSLLGDPELGGRAEDALADAESFVKELPAG